MTLTDTQQAMRAQGIGASEVAAILGVDPWRTPFDLWALKTGKVERQPEQVWHRRGHLLEPVIVEMYAGMHPGVAFDSPGTLQSASHPLAFATPDRAVIGADARWLLECKSKRGYAVQEWGESGTDDIPHHVILQCQWQLLVTELTRCDVGLLIDGEEYREYTVARDDELIAAAYDAAERFWQGFVVTDIPPALEGSTVSDYLQARFARYSDIVGVTSPAADAWMQRLIAVNGELDRLEEEKSRLVLQLKAEVADRKGIEGPVGRFTWSHTAGTIDYKAAAEALGLTEAAAEQYRRAASRRQRFTPAKGRAV